MNERIPAKGCHNLLVKPWANGTGKGNTCQLCGAIITDKVTGTSKAIQRRLMTVERTLHANRTVEVRTEQDLVQDEIDEGWRLEEAHVEAQAAKSKVTAEWERRWKKWPKIKKPDGSELRVSRSTKTGQKKRLLGGIKKTKKNISGKDGMRPSRRRERL